MMLDMLKADDIMRDTEEEDDLTAVSSRNWSPEDDDDLDLSSRSSLAAGGYSPAALADPVLLGDHRVLANMLAAEQQQHYLRHGGLLPGSAAAGHSASGVLQHQPEIRPHMRKIVLDWMLEVCQDQRCQPQVFHLAANYLDRYLSGHLVAKRHLQAVGTACLMLASKYADYAPMTADHLSAYTDHSVGAGELTDYWEMRVLTGLRWELSAVTSQTFLDHLTADRQIAAVTLSSSSSSSPSSGEEEEGHEVRTPLAACCNCCPVVLYCQCAGVGSCRQRANLLAAMAVTDARAFHLRPSQIAVAALWLSCQAAANDNDALQQLPEAGGLPADDVDPSDKPTSCLTAAAAGSSAEERLLLSREVAGSLTQKLLDLAVKLRPSCHLMEGSSLVEQNHRHSSIACSANHHLSSFEDVVCTRN